MSTKSKYAVLIVVRYPRWRGWLGLLSMAVFHLPLFSKSCIAFYKLLGTGRNGTFDLRPNWSEWAVFLTTNHLPLGYQQNNGLGLLKNWCGRFIAGWCKRFSTAVTITILECISSKGTWDGKTLFEANTSRNEDLPIAVLTRATIRFKQLRSFWQNVPAVAQSMATAAGLEYSIGIGEAPVYRQATFSIWTSARHMRDFAYKQQEHKAVISKTRTQQWYSEEMFSRFTVLHRTVI